MKGSSNNGLQQAIDAANSAVEAATGDKTMNSSFYSKMSVKERSAAYATVTCPTCDRKFNDKAAERHMPVCAQRVADGKRPISSRGTASAASSRRQVPPGGRTPAQASKTGGRKMIGGLHNSMLDSSTADIDRSQYQ